MDSGYNQKTQQNIPPPLDAMSALGVLQYTDAQATPIKFEINGVIDKGFFLADNEWTCYRRNYFSCICSFTLSPNYHGESMQFILASRPQTPYNVYGFAMCISAVVADSDTQTIDLVQHTPKRDKGPIAKPEKVRLQPKPVQTQQQQQFAPMGQMPLYAQATGLAPARPYDQPFMQGQSAMPNEHTFERIQFKQATANNGKRRAAQQYYHLVVELYADVGGSGSDQYIRIGYRRSAKMIVRGRSPGHYQSERRGSSGSGPSAGPGAGPGSGAGDGYGGGIMGHAYSGSLLSNPYASSYDTRHGSGYSTRSHHQEAPMEPALSPQETKEITETKGYQYFPSPIYESEPDPRNSVEVFQHRNEAEAGPAAHQSSMGDHTPKPKSEYQGSTFYPGTLYYPRYGRYDGKPNSNGFYPNVIPPSSTLNITS